MTQYIGLSTATEPPKPVHVFRLRDTLRQPKTTCGEVQDYNSYEPVQPTGEILSRYPLNARLELGFADIQRLQDDWDTYGAKTPSSGTIALAQSVCRLFPRSLQPEIFPEVDGSIGLYWDMDIIYSLFIKDEEGPLIRFSFETYDGRVLIDEDSLPKNFSTEEFASAMRKLVSRSIKK